MQHGGHIQITKTWALSSLKRMGFVKRKATTKSTPSMSGEEFERAKAGFLKQVAGMVQLHNIPDSPIINLDQTGVKLVPVGDWTMAAKGSRRVEVIGLADKRQITATFAASLDGNFLPMQILYQGKTDRSHPKYKFPDGFDIFIHPITGLMEKHVFAFFRRSSFPMSRKSGKKSGYHHRKPWF